MKTCHALLLTLVLCVLCAGCDKPAGVKARNKATSSNPKVPPEEQRLLDAARPFLDAVAARDYAKAFELLSSHAKERVSWNQFVPAADDKEFARAESNPVIKPTAQDFAAGMGRIEKEHGYPSKVRDVHVHETDTKVLSGQANAIETMFAIGNMPKSIPTDIRRASLRGQMRTKLTVAQLEEIARAHGTTAEELKKDRDFVPYFSFKLVLVDEAGALRIGYFEFLAPSIFD